MPQTRDAAAIEVLEDLLPPAALTNTLLINEYTEDFLTRLDVDFWHTHYNDFTEASPWPDQEKKYHNIIIRLPKSHTLFDYFLHAASSVSSVDTDIFVYGWNDEGIKGAQKKLTSFFGNVDVIGYKKRVRLIHSSHTESPSSKSFEDFETTQSVVSTNGTSVNLISYPGMFNNGLIDEATELLLTSLHKSSVQPKKILDYGCGTGYIAQQVAERFPGSSVDALDSDILSLIAAQKNASHVNAFLLANSLAHCESQSYDFIISNPPIHTAKTEQFDTLYALIKDAPKKLRPGGQLLLVTQSRIKLEDQFGQHFAMWTKKEETSRFTVWQGIT